jgi:hypothetical protein
MPDCPVCGYPAVPLLFGLPSSEAGDAADAGRLVLGGCCVEDANWACHGPGGHTWREGTDDDPLWLAAVEEAMRS